MPIIPWIFILLYCCWSFCFFYSVFHSPNAMGNISGQISMLGINTLGGMHIKSEPITPPRDTTTPSSQLRSQSVGAGHLSPSSGLTGHLSPSPAMTGHLSPSSGVHGMPGHLSPSAMGLPGHISPSIHLSPGQTIGHSNNSPPAPAQHLDYDRPIVKRSRMEGWTT